MATKMATKQKDSDGVQFMFTNGAVLGCGLNDLSESMVRQLAVHGLAQKIGDSYASSETLQDAIDSAKQTWDNLLAGNFNARVQGSGGVLAEAVARVKGITLEEAQAALGNLDEEQKAKLAKNPIIKATVDVIKGEKAVTKLDGLSDSDGLDDFLKPAQKDKKSK